MGLFKFKNAKDVKVKGCCCNVDCNGESMKAAKEKQGEGARVKILGSGCSKCNALEKNVREALRQLGKDIEIDHVTDFSDIASYGVMSTPALVVDGKVVSYGKVLKVEEAVKLLKDII